MKSLTSALSALALVAMLCPFALAATIKCTDSGGCEIKIYQTDGTLGPAIAVPKGTIIDSARAVAWGDGWTTQS